MTDELIRSRRRKKVKDELLGTGMVILPFLGFLFFTLFPMLTSFALSFSNLRSALIKEAEFTAGFKNYIYVLKDEYTWKAMRTTCVYHRRVYRLLRLKGFSCGVVVEKHGIR